MPFTPQKALVKHFVLCWVNINKGIDTCPSLFITGQIQIYQTNLKKRGYLITEITYLSCGAFLIAASGYFFLKEEALIQAPLLNMNHE